MSIAAAPGQRVFTGFPREAYEFLGQLARNNRRDWFAARRGAYRALLVQPAVALVAELGPRLRKRVSPELRAEPRVGGSILRQHHDARFAPGDQPFRPYLEVWFWEGSGGARFHPGLFLRIAPE